MPQIDLDLATYRAIDTTATLMGITHGEVVAHTLKRLSERDVTKKEAASPQETEPSLIAVYADYDGHRTHGFFDTETHRIDIVEEPLAGHYKTPSKAARAVISHYRPGGTGSRNGWSFWIIDDGTGNPIQSIRYTGVSLGDDGKVYLTSV